jgi:hypothetical protein
MAEGVDGYPVWVEVADLHWELGEAIGRPEQGAADVLRVRVQGNVLQVCVSVCVCVCVRARIVCTGWARRRGKRPAYCVHGVGEASGQRPWLGDKLRSQSELLRGFAHARI